MQHPASATATGPAPGSGPRPALRSVPTGPPVSPGGAAEALPVGDTDAAPALEEPDSPPAGRTVPFDPAEILAQARTENFPVAPVVLPRRLRRHLMAVYGYARLVDDIGDEAAGDRAALLDTVEADLARVWSGTPQHPLLAGLVGTVRECGLTPEPFLALLAANRQDLVVDRYETFDDLLGYCALSANPVGHLVLAVAGVATPDRLALSDTVCTALQLAEHWQDVAEDFAAGRVYLPQEDLRRFEVPERDLAAVSASPALRRLMAFEVDRATDLLAAGAPLVGRLDGRLRLAVAGFVAGGRAALESVRAADHDVLAIACRPRRRTVVSAAVRALATGGRVRWR